MDVAGISRPVLVVLIALSILLLAAGGSWALSWATRKTETTTRTLTAAKTVEIDGHSGDIRVIGTDRGDILLTTKKQRSMFGGPHGAVSFSDGRLHLDGSCPDFQLWGNDAGCSISYTLEALQGLVLQAELLRVNGYPDAWEWSDEALKRAADLVTRSGDSGGQTWNRDEVDVHLPWLLNARYGLGLPTEPAGIGRVFGYTDWLYGSESAGG